MATLKAVVLKHQQREDGTYNVKIRVTHERQTAYISTEHYLGPKQVSSDCKKIKDNFILSMIDFELARLRKEISRLGSRIYNLSAKALADHLIAYRKPGGGENVDFFEFSRKKISELRIEGRLSTASMYQAAENNLRDWLKRDYLDFKEITVKFLRDYEAHLRSRPDMGGRGIEANLASIRGLFNFARAEYNDEEADEIRIPAYPFVRYKIPRPEEPKQRSVSVEVLDNIRSYTYKRMSKYERKDQLSRPEVARDVFLLSFFLVGMNSKDIFELRADQIQEGRIIYRRAKTRDRRSDNAEISVKIEPEALEIMERYKDPSGVRAFSFYRRYSSPATFNSGLNRGLKVVGKDCGAPGLEFYAARHTWATIARNECNVSVDDISLALNHTDMNRRVTFKYIRKDFSKIDKANARVISFVNRFRAGRTI